MKKSQDENTENSLKVLSDFICDELMCLNVTLIPFVVPFRRLIYNPIRLTRQKDDKLVKITAEKARKFQVNYARKS